MDFGHPVSAFRRSAINAGVSFAFHALARLARLAPGETASAEELAAGLGASPSYLAHLMRRLTAAGLARAHAGAHGGYSLGPRGDNVSLKDVVSALSSAAALSAPELPICAACPLGAACPLRAVVAKAEATRQDVFARATVGGLARLLGAAERSPVAPIAPPPSSRGGHGRRYRRIRPGGIHVRKTQG